MKKSILIISCVLAAIMATSCGTTNQEPTAAAKAAAKTVMGADGVERPEWVLTGKEDATGIYAVGSAKLSNDQNSLKLARTNGRAELGRTILASTRSVLRSYTEDAGNAKDALTYMEEAIEVKSVNILKGSKQADMWKAEDGTIYVLMFVPYTAVLPEVTQSYNDFVQDTKTVFTEAKAQAAFQKYFDEN
ncbi:MAG: hypothetical protein KBT21_07695 [Treponema sp.]|nr:hypothetical protein [Candidatus Treponema merdequi]